MLELQTDTAVVVDTHLRPMNHVLGPRIRHADALNPDFLQKLTPDVVTEIPVSENPQAGRIGIINVISPYTRNLPHCMMLDTTGRYRPTPTEIPPEEGELMMRVAAESLAVMRELGSDTVVAGYNNSPWNYGKEEEQAGMQSVTTKWHMQLFGTRRADDRTASLHDPIVTENAREFIKGEPLNRLPAQLIEYYLYQMYPGVANFDSLRVNDNGLQIDLNTDLFSAMHQPGFFTEFIQPLHHKIEQAMIDIGGALTTVDYLKIRQLIRADFEESRNGIYPTLQADPILRPLTERKQRIDDLSNLGYPDFLISDLHYLNPLLRNRDQVGVSDWIRKGFGYALAFVQDSDTANPATLVIRPALRIVKSRGGVAEAVGIALHRDTNSHSSDEEVEQNRQHLRILKNHLESVFLHQSTTYI